jgi:hypothetical protein
VPKADEVRGDKRNKEMGGHVLNDSTPQQITDHRSQITDYRSLITDHQSPITIHWEG